MTSTNTTTTTTLVTSAPPNRSLQDGPCAFECPICFGIPLDPTLTPKCEHIFCNSCITQALDHSEHCPTCRTPLSHVSLKCLEKGTMLYRMWSQTPVQCRNSDVGCTWTGSVSEYQSHVGGCDPCQVLLRGDGMITTRRRKKICGEQGAEKDDEQQGEEKLPCQQNLMTKQQTRDSSFCSSSPPLLQDGRHALEKSIIMAARREEKTCRWTRQLGVLERQEKNLEKLLEEQRKMISRLRQQEHKRNLLQETTTVMPAAASTSALSTTSIMMSGCDAVQVTGAGVAQVNGLYKRTGSWDNVGMFTKKDVWENNVVQTFTLYRCNTYDNSKRWCISILPSCTTVVEIDFYQQEASGRRDEVPGMHSCQWVCVRRGRNGGGGMFQKEEKDCPPTRVTYIPAV